MRPRKVLSSLRHLPGCRQGSTDEVLMRGRVRLVCQLTSEAQGLLCIAGSQVQVRSAKGGFPVSLRTFCKPGFKLGSSAEFRGLRVIHCQSMADNGILRA